jgi:hypothetical protein
VRKLLRKGLLCYNLNDKLVDDIVLLLEKRRIRLRAEAAADPIEQSAPSGEQSTPGQNIPRSGSAKPKAERARKKKEGFT